MILLSTFLGQPSGDIADFYSISLVDGRIHLVFGHSAADITTFTTDGVYSDGFSHSLFINKQSNKEIRLKNKPFSDYKTEKSSFV